MLAKVAPTWTDELIPGSKERGMKACYCDESGTGDEPIAVMVGIIVDTQRMHITKEHWRELLEELSHLANREVSELHTRNFYAGNGIWRELDGPQRAQIITRIFDWLAERKHHVVYTSVCKKMYHSEFALQKIPDELNTVWRFLGFHLILAMQKYCQRESHNKGNTFYVFDNEEREQLRFTDIILRPPEWSDEYYSRKHKQDQLDQVVDVPYFGDSKDVALIQVADVASFFLRRYAEIKENLIPPKYTDEEQRVTEWIGLLKARSIGSSMIYPKSKRSVAEDIFFRNASESIRSL
ncbi:MAG: DUF3800 domain-containing protein [Bryobacteraceae bacterium]